MNDRPGCLWWFVVLATMLAGCVGLAGVVESTAENCPESNFSRSCVARVLRDLTSEGRPAPPPRRSAD
jgi:hypothetical protein